MSVKAAVEKPAKARTPKAPRRRRPVRAQIGMRGTYSEKIISFCFLVPSLIGVMVFFVAPFAQIIRYALVDNPISNNFVGFQNFISVFKNSAFQMAARNTARFSAIAVPLAVVLSLLLAMILEAKIPGKSKFRTFFLSPMMVPVASIVLIWQVIFDFNGALNGVIIALGFTPIDWMKSDYSHIIVVILFLWKNLGYFMILFMAALSNVPKALLEAASVDGASSVRRFFQLKLRFITPTLLFVTILSLINSFKVFREVYLLTGDYPYEDLYLLQHFMNNTFRSLDYQKLSAAALIMGVAMALIIGILFTAEGRIGRDLEQ